MNRIKTPQYYVYDGLPVKLEPTPRGGLKVKVFQRGTKKFKGDSTYLSHLLYDRDNLAREVTVEEFRRQVGRLHNYRGVKRAAKAFPYLRPLPLAH